ncbi:hypothetical protein FOXG_21253 [Fusarium oxysporum f. sp. lycopersici 4287]|uniref:Uncharacterized protein n=2 Tax=Fusarium oxysporum TaxID=5507 RepID=A0A0J9WSY1_FUSO4|nr:hypothetical protein FOXG_21253 [Fusarium oxysporum f. sp. lycopersici 4287]EXK34826.1 hypothetical protein FOMG_10174 [Fusarium oxysporum f. sp. melonis 26406]KNB15072.1 hypothetical protein FOXG_21253 [Fusarium oxysporum f. sp. lycopersici 4287]
MSGPREPASFRSCHPPMPKSVHSHGNVQGHVQGMNPESRGLVEDGLSKRDMARRCLRGGLPRGVRRLQTLN